RRLGALGQFQVRGGAKLIRRVSMVLQFVDLLVAAEGTPPAKRGGGGVKVGEQESAARRQDAGEFAHRGERIPSVTESQCAEHQVGRGTRDRERSCVANREPPAQPGFRRRDAEHRRGGIYADGGETRRPPRGGGGGPRSRAATHALPAPRSATASCPRYRPKACNLRAPKRVWRPSEALQPRLAQANQLLRQAQFARKTVSARCVAPTAQRLQQRTAPAGQSHILHGGPTRIHHGFKILYAAPDVRRQ